MRDIDWKILLALYNCKSMTKAAESLYMTQPALTKRVHAMEDEWKTELVKRSSQGVIFTEAGEYLVQKAEVIESLMQEIEEHFARTGTKELLKIGLPNTFSRVYMPRLFGAYMKQYNNVLLRTVLDSSDALMQRLEEGSIDMAVINGDYPFLGERYHLFDEGLFVVAPKDFSLERAQEYPLIESHFNPMVRSLIIQWWIQTFGRMPRESHKVPYADIAIDMVENGLGITFLFGDQWRIDRDKLQMLPIPSRDGSQITRSVSLMVSGRCYDNSALMEFVNFVREYFTDRS